jgi:hypothetical protein
MLRKCRDWRQETSRTVIVKTDFYEERKASKRFLYFPCTKDNLMWELQINLAHPLINL